MDRRTFVYNAALGTLTLGLTGMRIRQPDSALKSLKIDVHAPDMPRSPLGMPGLFPGRVVEAFHSAAIVDRRVSPPAVRAMVDAGMTALTGESEPKNAWAKFFDSARRRRDQGQPVRRPRHRDVDSAAARGDSRR